MLKLALIFELIFFYVLTCNAQKKIGFACGLSSIDVYDERLDRKVFSGSTALWTLTYENKESNKLHIDFLSKTLKPPKKGLMATKDELLFKQANIRYTKYFTLTDTSAKKHWSIKYGFTSNIYGRYGIHNQSSTILPYDETTYSYQLSLTLGIHFGLNYVLPSKNQIRCNLMAQLINTGMNNPYSPHGNVSVYQTLIAPRFFDLSLPLVYSHKFSKKIYLEFQIKGEYYSYYFEQENKILWLSTSLGLNFSL